MIPAANSAGVAIKAVEPVTNQNAQRAVQQAVAETTRGSAGEASASNVKLQTANAVTAPEQTAVAPRLRDQESAERTERDVPPANIPAGPPPTFEESPLERQARVALEPPELSLPATEDEPTPDIANDAEQKPAELPEISQNEDALADPPPTPSERAEASFAETKTMSEPKEAATVDMSR